MIADARSVSRDEIVETDVCIVGGGIAGLTLAHELVDQGFQVLLLESGDLARDDETQALYRGESVGRPYFRLEEARARLLGGSANFWDVDLGDGRLGARLRPLDPVDFEERDWVPYSGWPFGRSHLDPFYDRAQSMLRVEPFTYDLDAWEDRAERPRLPLRSDDVTTIVFKFGAQDVFTVGYRNEIVRRAENVIALVHANVVEIETDETAQTVTRVRVACLQGNRFWVAARLFILAAGGLEVPRLLLASRGTRSTGLGNQHDLVGRFFMEHLHFSSGVYLPAHADLAGRMQLYSRIHEVKGVPIIGKLALAAATLRRERLLNGCIQFVPRRITRAELFPAIVSRGARSFDLLLASLMRGRVPEDAGRHLWNVLAGWEDALQQGYRKMRRRVAARLDTERLPAFRPAYMTEQMPNPDSRVTLSPERDALGQNRVRLDWRLSAVDMTSVVRMQAIVDAALRGAGLGRLYPALRDDTPPSGGIPLGVHGGNHHMGTTRMHVDPRKGVVDPDSRVHGVSNLFIAGPSVFPTGGYANPVLTVVALTLRLADHVKKLMKDGGGMSV